jgi:membrane protease YdiL (CAAX protease family)
MSTGPSPEEIPEVIVAESEPLLVIPVVPAEEKRPFLSGLGVVLAWLVILSVVGVIVIGVRTKWSNSKKGAESEPTTASAAQADSRALMGAKIMEFEGRYLVGSASFIGNAAEFYRSAEQLNSGPMSQRVRFAILAGELSGPQEALKRLSELDPNDREDVKVRRVLAQIYDDYSKERYSAPSVSDEERTQLDDYGWFGKLALYPAVSSDSSARKAVIEEARKFVLAAWSVIALIGFVGLLGLFGLMALLAFSLSGSLRSKLRIEGRYGGVYAETFALYFLLFFGLSLLAGTFDGNILLLDAIIALLSLLALAWPVVRGVAWQQVCQDVGLTRGRGFLVEPILGLAGYAMSMPILAVGVVLVLWMLAQGAVKGDAARPETSASTDNGGDSSPPSTASNPLLPDDSPAHPLVFMDMRGWWNKFLMLFLGCVVAPLVEETMFRGVLYRHLRGATGRFGSFLSIVVSGSIVSFIFAAIHPQGWIAIPALMALAYGFTILREWRGTLIPGMVAHGLNNGIMLTAVMLILGN